MRESGGPLDLLARAVYDAGDTGTTVPALAAAQHRPVEEVRAEVGTLVEEGVLVALSAQAVVHRERWSALAERPGRGDGCVHQANPPRVMPREELHTRARAPFRGALSG